MPNKVKLSKYWSVNQKGERGEISVGYLIPTLIQSSYGLNSTTTVLLEGWIWHWITHEGWCVIKTKKPKKTLIKRKMNQEKRIVIGIKKEERINWMEGGWERCREKDKEEKDKEISKQRRDRWVKDFLFIISVQKSEKKRSW